METSKKARDAYNGKFEIQTSNAKGFNNLSFHESLVFTVYDIIIYE